MISWAWSAGMTTRWVFLRGLARGNPHWGTFIQDFKLQMPAAEVELWELPGNGTQYQKRTPCELKEAINALKAQSAFCQNNQPFHFCGISLGAMVGLAWANQEPERFLSVTTINTSFSQISPITKRLIPENYTKLLATLFSWSAEGRESQILSIVSNQFAQTKTFVEPFSKFSKDHPLSMTNFFRQLGLAHAIELKEIPKVPVHVIVSAHDRLVHPSCSYELAKKLNVKPLIHETAGHDLPLDDPHWLIEQLKNF